jgi:hypothetical protein
MCISIGRRPAEANHPILPVFGRFIPVFAATFSRLDSRAWVSKPLITNYIFARRAVEARKFPVAFPFEREPWTLLRRRGGLCDRDLVADDRAEILAHVVVAR